MTEFRFDLPESIVETIAERAAALVLERLDGKTGQPELLSVPEADELLRCSRQSVYDLLSAGRLERLKDGSRVLV